MGKERRFLEDVTDPSAMNGEIDPAFSVEVDFSVYPDHA